MLVWCTRHTVKISLVSVLNTKTCGCPSLCCTHPGLLQRLHNVPTHMHTKMLLKSCSVLFTKSAVLVTVHLHASKKLN